MLYDVKTILRSNLRFFAATMRVYQDFFVYRSGIYRHSRSAIHDSDSEPSYHSVRIIGWGEETSYRGPPIKYWVSLRRIT